MPMLFPRKILALFITMTFLGKGLLQVWSAPTLVLDVGDVLVPNGSVNGTPATFSVTASGVGALTYQWFRVEARFDGSAAAPTFWWDKPPLKPS